MQITVDLILSDMNVRRPNGLAIELDGRQADLSVMLGFLTSGAFFE